jgi:hypothetical protein
MPDIFANLSPLQFVQEAKDQLKATKIPPLLLRDSLESFRLSVLAVPSAGLILERLDLKSCALDAGLYAFPIPMELRGVAQILDLNYIWLSYEHSIIVLRASIRKPHVRPTMTGFTPEEIEQISCALDVVQGS